MARYKIIDDHGIYFTTYTVVEWLPIFRGKRYFEIIVESLKYCPDNKGEKTKEYLFSGMLLCSLISHLIAQTKKDGRFQDVMRDMKKFASKAISRELERDGQNLSLYVFKKAAENKKGKRKYKVWQHEYHPKIIYTDAMCCQWLRYMHDIPSERVCDEVRFPRR